MFRIIIFLYLFSFCFSSYAQTRIAPEKPKLIIGIVVENLRPEYIEKYQSNFSKNGLRKMSSEGTWVKHLQFDFLVNQTAPACASLVSGTSPSSHGIVANEWYNRRKNEMIDCCFDPAYKAIGDAAYSGKVSNQHFHATTVFDELQLYTSGKSKVITIAADAQTAVLLGGNTADAAYWFDDKKGNWISNSYYLETLPSWVDTFNNKRLPQFYLDKTWDRIYLSSKYSVDEDKAKRYEKGFKKLGRDFPYELEKLSAKSDDYKLLFQTPFGNLLTKDFALNCIINEEMGKDEVTDVLLISFKTMAEVERVFSSQSEEIQDVMYRFDNDMAHLLSFIEEELGKENVLVFLTSTGQLLPEKELMEDEKFPTGILDPSRMTTLIRAYMNAEFGPGDWLLKYANQQVYLNRELINDSELSLMEVQIKLANLMTEMSAIQSVNISQNLDFQEYTRGVNQKMQYSYYPERSGDLFIHLKNGYQEKKNKYKPYPYLSQADVPLICYGWKIKRTRILRPVSICDVAPTLSEILQIPLPSNSSGVLIDELIPN